MPDVSTCIGGELEETHQSTVSLLENRTEPFDFQGPVGSHSWPPSSPSCESAPFADGDLELDYPSAGGEGKFGARTKGVRLLAHFYMATRNISVIEAKSFTDLHPTELPTKVNPSRANTSRTYMAFSEGFRSFFNDIIIFWSG